LSWSRRRVSNGERENLTEGGDEGFGGGWGFQPFQQGKRVYLCVVGVFSKKRRGKKKVEPGGRARHLRGRGGEKGKG